MKMCFYLRASSRRAGFERKKNNSRFWIRPRCGDKEEEKEEEEGEEEEEEEEEE